MKTGVHLALACLVLAGCTPLADAQDDPPHRPTIVSVNPCADAILGEIADPAQILAISHYSHDPRSSSMPMAVARRFRSTGGTVEEILALKPDIVIAGAFLPYNTKVALERMGIAVAGFDIAHNVSESLAQVRQIGIVTGNAARGRELAARIETAVAQAAPPPGETPVTTILWQSGGIVPGDNTLVNDLLQRTGFDSLSSRRGLRQADYLPLESVLHDPPALILTAGTPGDGEDRMLAHPALQALAHTRRERFDPSMLYCGGPTIVRAVQRLADIRRGYRS